MYKLHSTSEIAEANTAAGSSVGQSVVSGRTKQTRFNTQQYELLQFLYSRRFVTTKQVQQFLGKAQIQQAQQRLNTLLAKAYIGRRYSSEDKLLGRYAIYYLLPGGMELLKGYGSKHAFRLMKKDATASLRFMQHSVAIGDTATELLRLYPSPTYQTQFLTKTDALKSDADHDDGSSSYEPWTSVCPKPFPDGYLSTKQVTDGAQPTTAFVEVWHETIPFWVYRKRILYYSDYFYDADCVAVVGDERLTILLVCDTPTLQRRVQRYLRRISYSMYSDELRFLVTNQTLLAAATTSTPILTQVGDETNEVLSLVDVTVE